MYLLPISKNLIPCWICDKANIDKFNFSVLNKILPDDEKEEARAYKNIQLKFCLYRDPLFMSEESR